MRARPAIAALLILVLAASALGCVAGWATTSHDRCSDDRCPRRPAAHGTAMQAALGHCGMRTFVQFHFVAFHRFEFAAPLRVSGTIPIPRPRTLILSSIGSPETDRGPPLL